MTQLEKMKAKLELARKQFRSELDAHDEGTTDEERKATEPMPEAEIKAMATRVVVAARESTDEAFNQMFDELMALGTLLMKARGA